MAIPYIFSSGTTIYASQVNSNFAAVALTDLSNLSLARTAGNVLIGTGSGFTSNALTAGSGITITPGAGTVTIAATGATGLTVGTSTIASGSNAYILYNNAGVLGNYAISGSGTTVAMATGAALTTPTMQTGGFGTTPQLTAPSYAQGLVWYDSGNDGLSYYNGATGNQVIAGQQVQLRVYNATASIIPIGTPVYITGTFNALPTVAPAVNTSLAASQCIGLTTQAIAVSGTGYAMSVGTLSGLNTSAYTAGNALYVGATAGTLTSTQPTGSAFSSLVGYVAVSDASTGKITVNATPSNPSSGSSGLTVGSTTITSGTTGRVLYDNAGVVGEYSVVPVANGGTGTSTPSLVAGSNISVTGTWPNQTIASTGGGSSINVQQAGSTVVTGLTTLNFVQGAVVTGSSTTANISIYNATATLAPPQVRGYSYVTGSTASFNVPFPTGTVAGDFAIICGAGGYGPSAPPSGWTSLNSGSASGIQGATFSKTLTSGDLSTGYVTVTFNNAYNGICQMVTFKGAATVRNTQGNADGGTTLTSSSAVQVNDLGVHFATVRSGSITSVTPGTVRQSSAISDINAAIYTAAVSTAGVQSVVYSVTGDYYICSVFVDNVAGAYTVTGETTTIAAGAPLVAAQEGYRYYDSANSYAPYIYDNGGWQQVGPLPSIPALANVPVASTFTYTLGSPTSKTTQAGVGVLFDSGTFGNSDNITGYGVAVPGSTPYTFTLGMSSPLIQQANMIAGMFLTDGTKVVTIGNAAQSTGGVKIDQWANNTTYAGQPFWQTGQMYPFFRVTNNGTNLTYYYSLNGYSWLAFYQEAIAAYLGTITYAGFCINNTYTSGQAPPTGTHGQATVFYWLQS